jgi:GntR family transcriptional regulator, phosphonate transport system regulatory protein
MTSTRYLEIAERLAAELAGCPPGTRVASEPELAGRFGVGRAAARSALQELERRLLVRRVQGAGTFVNRRIDYVISRRTPPSWHTTVSAAGGTPRSQIKSVLRTELTEDPARRLALPVGTRAFRIVRHFYLDDLLGSWTEEWVPVDLAPDLELALHAVESIDLVLRQMGRVDPVRAWCRVSVDLASDEVIGALGVEASAQLWLVESLSRDRSSGRALMCSRAWTRTDAIRVVVELGEQEGT